MREGFDPVAELARIRTEQPVFPMQIPGGQTVWLATRYEDVRAVLGDTGRFSNDFGNVIGMGATQDDPGGLGFRDPPEHTRLRRYLTPEFTMRRLRRLEPRIEAIVEEHLDAMERKGSPSTWSRCSRCRSPRSWCANCSACRTTSARTSCASAPTGSTSPQGPRPRWTR
ncbi:cytochrome P450 [Nonomuraea recticatena]|uniref:cytochrome P450 n=1 Tax=Nonomuraea recticatena TaxID=46178 RepID=UPI003614A366